MVGTYPLLDDVPFLATLDCEWLPDLLAHAHILLGDLFKLPYVPVVSTLALHQAFVPLATCIGCLVGEVGASNLCPIESLLSGRQEILIILR